MPQMLTQIAFGLSSEEQNENMKFTLRVQKSKKVNGFIIKSINKTVGQLSNDKNILNSYSVKTSERVSQKTDFKSQNDCNLMNILKQKTISMKTHSKYCNSNEPFVCQINGCVSQFKSKNELRSHQVDVHDHMIFDCHFVGCGQCFTTKSRLISHQSIHRKEKLFNYKTKREKCLNFKFKCEFEGCHKVFTKSNTLKQHLETHTTKTISCDWNGCLYTTNSGHNLGQHKKRVHLSEPNFVCDWTECGKAFKYKKVLIEHQRRHKNEKPFACEWPGCEYRSAANSSLITHKNIHSNKKLSCDWPGCQFATNTTINLKNHTKIHEREHRDSNNSMDTTKMSCDWPGCHFSGYYLHAHKKVHSNERKYMCVWPQCDKTFKFSAVLKVHQRTHTNEKPYACEWPGCDHRFTTKSNLKTHNRVHNKI